MEPISQVRIDFIKWVRGLNDDRCRVVLGLVQVVKAERGKARSARVERRAVLPASN